MSVGAHGLRTIALGFPLYAFGMTVTQSFNGAGGTWTPTWINLGVFWLTEIPLAWLLATRTGLGPMSAIISITAAYSGLAGVNSALFRRGKWKGRVV